MLMFLVQLFLNPHKNCINFFKGKNNGINLLMLVSEEKCFGMGNGSIFTCICVSFIACIHFDHGVESL